MRINAKHLQEWVGDGKAFVLGAEITHKLVDHLENKLAWNPLGTRLAWNDIGGVEADLTRISEADLVAWAKSTPLGRDDYLIFVLRRNELCLACSTELGMANIDYIFSGIPGVHYIFGGELRDGSIHPLLDHLAEYDDPDSLIVAT